MQRVAQPSQIMANGEQPAVSWRDVLSQSVTAPEALTGRLYADAAEIRKVTVRYPMRINPYYLGLIENPGDPIYRQCIPDPREITDDAGWEDPLDEEASSPVPGLTHRYPDRVLFLVSARCAVYCRFCNRKRKVGHPAPFPLELPYRLIQLYTYEGEVVLDPFMGSGQTALAALKAGRSYVGYDINGEYADLADRRIANYLNGT